MTVTNDASGLQEPHFNPWDPEVRHNSICIAGCHNHGGNIGGDSPADPTPDLNRLLVHAATPVPRCDPSGRIHGDIPREVPDDWDVDTIEDALQEVERSLWNRHGNQEHLGHDKKPGHRYRIREEIDWRNMLEDALRFEPPPAYAVEGGLLMTIGTGLMCFGGTATVALAADDVTVVGTLDDVLIIGTGAMFFVGGAIRWMAGGS